MRKTRLDEAESGIKIAGRFIHNLRYAVETTLMADSEEEQKSLLMKVKEKSEKPGLKLNIKKMNLMASGPITSWQISSVQFSHSVVSGSLRPHELQLARPPCPSPTPGVHSTHVHRVSDAIQSSHPLSSPSPPALNPSQHQGLFQ